LTLTLPTASTLTLSTAFPRSTASFSVHFVFLLVYAAHSPATALPMPAATRHGKGVAPQVAVEPSLDDFAQFARHEREHLDTVRCHQFVQRPGDRAANQDTDAQIRQTKRLFDRQVVSERLLRFADDPFRLGLDNVKMPCRVKDRRDPIVPVCKCGFHHPKPCSSFTYGRIASAVPNGDERHRRYVKHWKL
jgi:hypothetical protein